MRAIVLVFNFMSVLGLLACLSLVGALENHGIVGILNHEVEDGAGAVSLPHHHLSIPDAINKADGPPYGYPHSAHSSSAGGAGITAATARGTAFHTGGLRALPQLALSLSTDIA